MFIEAVAIKINIIIVLNGVIQQKCVLAAPRTSTHAMDRRSQAIQALRSTPHTLGYWRSPPFGYVSAIVCK